VNNRHSIGSLERVFEAVSGEFAKLRGQRAPIRATWWTARPRDARHVPARDGFHRAPSFLLASTGSVRPVRRPLRTVWGIMHSFRSLLNVQQATLARSPPHRARRWSPPRSGLFAAIPAVVAYNRYSHDIERLANRFESFMEEFSNILHRQAVK